MDELNLDPSYFLDEHYCPVRHMPRLQACTSFREAGIIAVEVLAEMRSKYPSDTVFHQVCGPMSTGPGTIREKLLRFKKAIEYLRGQGKTIFNQVPVQIVIGPLWYKWKAAQTDPKAYCYELLEEVYRPLFASGHLNVLVFMPNSNLSTGTIWENETGPALGLKMEHFPEDWEAQHDAAIKS